MPESIRTARPVRHLAQRSFDDLGTPLHEVTFCVVDLETTGTSAEHCAITEIGAVKVRGGEVLGTFATLINPGCAVPPEITVITGITEAMVHSAPRIESVLAAFLAFCDGAVIVGHNVRFDLGFLNAALERTGRPRLDAPVVDTVALARRLVRDEVPNCRLGTLADRLRLEHRPSHRALDDAWATVDLLHHLIERAAAFGVLGLDDLVCLPRLGNHPQVAKLRFTDSLPRTAGVYLFRGPTGDVLYVGKATNLRQRVRSYFSGDERRKVGTLLREAQSIDHIACHSTLDAAVMEVRLIHQHQPRYNQQSKLWGRYRYVKLTLDERFPRLSIVKEPTSGRALYLGPVASAASARQLCDAIESVTRLRRCSTRITPRGRRAEALCTAAQLGVACCPCTGELSEADYARVVSDVVLGLTTEPERLLSRLQTRMQELAQVRRFEEAADARDRAAALARVLDRQRRFDALRAAGTLQLQLPDGLQATLRHGILVDIAVPDATATLPGLAAVAPAVRTDMVGQLERPVPRHLADELRCVSTWLHEHATSVRVVACEHGWSAPAVPLPTFAAARGVQMPSRAA